MRALNALIGVLATPVLFVLFANLMNTYIFTDLSKEAGYVVGFHFLVGFFCLVAAFACTVLIVNSYDWRYQKKFNKKISALGLDLDYKLYTADVFVGIDLKSRKVVCGKLKNHAVVNFDQITSISKTDFSSMEDGNSKGGYCLDINTNSFEKPLHRLDFRNILVNRDDAHSRLRVALNIN